ncbi:uncharacterized protein METZ01_LOCUS352897, partial [marine metagenome]
VDFSTQPHQRMAQADSEVRLISRIAWLAMPEFTKSYLYAQQGYVVLRTLSMITF